MSDAIQLRVMFHRGNNSNICTTYYAGRFRPRKKVDGCAAQFENLMCCGVCLAGWLDGGAGCRVQVGLLPVQCSAGRPTTAWLEGLLACRVVGLPGSSVRLARLA